MKRSGTVTIDGVGFKYNLRVTEAGTKNGINGGRINRLHILKTCTPNHYVAEFFGGKWNIEPYREDEKRALEKVLKMFN